MVLSCLVSPDFVAVMGMHNEQFVDKWIVNLLLAAYFAVIGAFALAATVDPVLVQLFGITVR